MYTEDFKAIITDVDKQGRELVSLRKRIELLKVENKHLQTSNAKLANKNRLALDTIKRIIKRLKNVEDAA